MKRRRLTKAERDEQQRAADKRVWDVFQPRLAAAKSRVEAEQLMAEAPPPDSPGHRYYSNLGFFLMTFAPPGRSSYVEKGLYIQLLQRMDAAGEVKVGHAPGLLAELRRAMNEQRGW